MQAVRLDDDRILADAKRRRQLAQHAAAVDATTARLRERSLRLQAKAFRLPKGSNGRAAAVRESQTCSMLAELLRRALNGDRTPKVDIGQPSRHAQRALELLHTLQAI